MRGNGARPGDRHDKQGSLVRYTSIWARTRLPAPPVGTGLYWRYHVKKTFILAALATAAVATPAFAQDASVIAGPRLEAVAGYDRINTDGEKDGGALFGIGAGYDVAVNPTVALGADVEVSKSSVKDEFLPGEEIKAGRDLYAGARATFAVTPGANLYVKGGYTNARVKYEGSLGNDAANLEGFRLGAGGQVSLGGKAYAGAEYRYSKYDEYNSRNQVVATIGTRF